MPSCVIIVENLPVPLDRRVWQEATALRDASWTVSVICPTTDKYPKHFEIIDGINIFRHSLPLEAHGARGFLLEYAAALFHEFRLLFTVHRAVGFDIIQACNPPDLILFSALPWKLWGKKLVYDQHDVCPELVVAKFGEKRFLKTAAILAEKFSLKIADLVISANDTFRQLAIDRGGKRPDDVVTVHSIPDKRFFARSKPIEGAELNDRVVIGYVGVIGTQDGVENVVLMANHLVKDHGITNFNCIIVGAGPALCDVKALAARLGMNEYFTFTGYLTGMEFLDQLSGFQIGIIPDPINSYNDKISMNKVFEYAEMGLPIVAFNLSETRRLLGDAAIFATRDDAAGLATEMARLLCQPELRREFGLRAKALADSSFDWSIEAGKYVAALTRLSM
jgi:glycosyltransferase involved in cell wall biosynthesis